MKKAIEIGSEFHWLGLAKGPFLPWPAPHLFLALGRDAVLSLWEKSKGRNAGAALFIPDYFCPDVRKYWKDNGIRVRQYEDDPRWPHPNWETLAPARGDYVLAVNYFGVREGSVWGNWHKSNPHVSLVEDHSHDPFSVWAKTSSADYCFASIRKIFSAPDGAVLWSPKRHSLPSEPENRNWSASALKLAGMIWKKEYLDRKRRDLLLRGNFRKFQIEGERLLSMGKGLCISPWSRDLLLNGFPKACRIKREKNTRFLLKLLRKSPNFKPLFSEWPLGHCPFNVVLVFKTRKLREVFRSRIISKKIFTPVHWPLPLGKDSHAFDLSSRILTIPVDYRYGVSDMHFIADTVKEIDF